MVQIMFLCLIRLLNFSRMNILKICLLGIMALSRHWMYAQYIHFNNQYLHSAGMQYAKCTENIVALHYKSHFFNSKITKATVDYDGQELAYQELSLPTEAGPTSYNPAEVIIALSDETFIAAGSRLECGSNLPYVCSFDADLNLLWDVDLIDWLDCETNDFAPGGLAKINETSFALSSGVSIHNESTYDEFGYRLTSFDSDGNILMDNTYYRTDLQYNSIYGMEKLVTGYAIWGSCSGPQSNGLGCVGDIINYVLHTDDQGAPIGIYFFEDEDVVWDGYVAMELLPDGNMLAMYGYNYESDCDLWKQKAKPRAVLMNMQTLTPIWDFVLEIPELENLWLAALHFQDIVLATDSGFVATCQVQVAGNEAYGVVIKIGAGGELAWYRILHGPNLPTLNAVESLSATPDGGYVIGGWTNDPEGSMWIVKLDACGYEVESGCPAIVGIEEDATSVTSVWPNPFKSTLNATLSSQTKRIEISDMTGRIVFTENVFYPNQQWDLKALASGSYLFKTVFENGVCEVTKILKE